ncbi:MAG TPA: cellulase family glycosylhydrolase [Longimicrobium sp.]|nr:cellulase family glycosylhydrolase [Longimicrobium sp.]
MYLTFDPRSLSRRVAAAGAACLLLASCDTKDNPAFVQPTVACDGNGGATINGNAVAIAPGGYFTAGNKIYSAASCQPVRFYGVSRPSLSFNATGDRLGDSVTTEHDFAAIRSWKANMVRIELASYYWVPTAGSYSASYAGRVERVVRQARRAGLNVILALQASDRGVASFVPSGNTHQPMPDRNHAIPFWTDVANRFKNDGGVMYELFSEPFPVGGRGGFSNWGMWKNGGLHPADNVYEPRPAFQAVGMQELYNLVRGTGAHNLVIIGGTKWGYYLDGVPKNRVNGYNLVYATHPWDFPGANQPGDWQKDWAFLAKTDPVMVTEFGQFDCGDDYVRALLDKADELGLSWTAWMWSAPRPGESTAQNGPDDVVCERSYLVMDWTGTPSKTGQTIKNRLATY